MSLCCLPADNYFDWEWSGCGRGVYVGGVRLNVTFWLKCYFLA